MCKNKKANCSSLTTADSLDVDYDGSSRTLVLTGFWSRPDGGWTEEIRRPANKKTDRVEVGLFIVGESRSGEYDDLLADGRLAVIGEDRKLS